MVISGNGFLDIIMIAVAICYGYYIIKNKKVRVKPRIK
jgi:hypothetical protein